jgi:hypothetical protein
LPLWLYDTTLGLNTGPLIDPTWDENARVAAETYAVALALVHLANELDADLIVMSTSAMTDVIRTVLGSVAGDVVRESGRPVLLVRRTRPPFAEPTARDGTGELTEIVEGAGA